jgi:anti-sigma factor RsiW
MPSRDEKLHKLHDGELSAADAEALRGELTADDHRKLEALSELDQLLHESLSAEVDAHPIDLWAGLSEKLPELKRAKEPAVVPLRRRIAFRLTAGASALAAAAALLLIMRTVPTVNNHVDVEDLEVAGNNAAVLSVADDHGNETTLIWFDHQEDDQWETL